MNLDDGTRPDVKEVLDAAAALDVTEFELFRLAYRSWHGGAGDEQLIEQYFVPYMLRDVVPHWVRSFARKVLMLARSGRLEPAALGVERLPRSREMVRRGVRFAVILGLSLGILILFGELAARALGLAGRCLFPPCY